MSLRGRVQGAGRWWAAVCCGAVLSLGTARAAEPEPSGRSVQFNFVQADIHTVTKIVGAATGKTFIVPEDVTGKVTILTQGPVPAEEV
ncbi:MAG TPA: hypothetical protein PL011_11550, partial [Kiritimatiellia bacterium]|nr:hypothetical protein [Kiritimatiellia bacterium]